MKRYEGHLSIEAVDYCEQFFYDIQFRCCDIDAEESIFFTTKGSISHEAKFLTVSIATCCDTKQAIHCSFQYVVKTTNSLQEIKLLTSQHLHFVSSLT